MMIYDPVFQAVVFGLLIAFGVACDRAYLTLKAWRARQARRQFLGASSRREVEPQIGRWTVEHGRTSWR